MVISLPSFREHYTRYILGAFVLVALVYGLFVLQLTTENYLALTWVALIVALFVLGNKFIWRAMDRFLGWAKFMSIRFFSQLFVSLAYILFLINSSYFLLKELVTADPPTPEQVFNMNIIGAIIAIPLLSISFGLHFLRAWKTSELESEMLQKENMKSQLEALKNHLDPHFLFNNLNILAALIDKDTKLSKQFLEKFAEVYRFLLQNKGDELVDLKNELHFLESYIFLINCRFQSNVKFDSHISCDRDACFIPPLTVQMLIENGIKHNIISDAKPLTFKLFVEDEYLVIENNLQPKNLENYSHKSGLNNIKARYAHFTDMEVKVEKSEDAFKVKVPLIEIEEI